MQPSFHIARSLASLFKTLASMNFLIAFFYLFFILPLFEPLSTKLFAFTEALSSSVFSMCTNHRNLCSLKNSFIFSTLVISRIILLLTTSLSVLPPIICNIFISVYSLQLSNQKIYSILAMFLNFFHPHLVLTVTTSCTPKSRAENIPKIQEFYYFFNCIIIYCHFFINFSTKLRLVLFNKKIALMDLQLH